MEENEVRLQKVLASAGLGSRRKCEEFITAGRVSVNGEVIDELGSRVDPDVDIIHVDGVRIAQTSGHIVVALNKPRGVVTTMSDDQGRECVGDLVAEFEQRLFHVGRLDADTEGLLLLTNDGELSQRLGHPSHGIVKTYSNFGYLDEFPRKTLPKSSLGFRLRALQLQLRIARFMKVAKIRP